MYLGFSGDSASIMSINAKKFLWPELLEYFKGKTEENIQDLIKLISKIDVIQDPGS